MPDKGRTLPADPCLWGSEQWHYVPHRCLERCGPWRGSQGCDHHWTWCGCHTFLQSISHILGFKTCLFYSYFTIHQQHIKKKIRLLTNNIHVHIHFIRLDNTLFILLKQRSDRTPYLPPWLCSWHRGSRGAFPRAWWGHRRDPLQQRSVHPRRPHGCRYWRHLQNGNMALKRGVRG